MDSEVRSNRNIVFIGTTAVVHLRTRNTFGSDKKLKMNAECLQWFQQAFDSLFNRWTALKLAVEHSDDTRKGLQVNNLLINFIADANQTSPAHFQTAIEIKGWLFDYCTQNDDVHESEVRDNLEEIMDQEFDAICEDNSVNGKAMGADCDVVRFCNNAFLISAELSDQIVGYLKLCIAGRFDEVQQRLAQLPQCTSWLVPGFQVTKAIRDDSDSASDDDSDEDMETDSDAAPELVDANRRPRNAPPQVDEDGFTMVGRRR